MTASKTTARRAGQVYTLNAQADIWQGRYKLIERVPGKPGAWIVEYLPDTPETTQRIRDYWAATTAMTDPVWDKTWAECADGERPQRTGWKTREQMAEKEIAARAATAGTRATVQFVSSRKWAEYF